MNQEAKYLFSQHLVCDVIEWTRKKIIEEAESFESNRIINATVDELCEYFEEKYRIYIPILKEEDIEIDEPREIMIEEIRGTSITYHIPFEGDKDVFNWLRPYTRQGEPTQIGINPPKGLIKDDEILLSYEVTGHDPEFIISSFKRDFSNVKEILRRLNIEISEFNASIVNSIKGILEFRQKKLLADKSIVKSLGYPLRRRENAPNTFIVPTIRRKVEIPRSSTRTVPYTPEPELDIKEYDHILSVISNMVRVMEQSPHAFIGMKEEDLRQHFLVQLNGQYVGQATGETFNFEGKTDIIVKVEGKNIFIAECKFWDGPEALTKAINQLLGYVSWRDTKIALLIFNRRKYFSQVLKQIPGLVKAHPNFKRELQHDADKGFRYILHHRDDTNREFILTILAFEVPI